jgi:hypothetical protein
MKRSASFSLKSLTGLLTIIVVIGLSTLWLYCFVEAGEKNFHYFLAAAKAEGLASDTWDYSWTPYFSKKALTDSFSIFADFIVTIFFTNTVAAIISTGLAIGFAIKFWINEKKTITEKKILNLKSSSHKKVGNGSPLPSNITKDHSSVVKKSTQKNKSDSRRPKLGWKLIAIILYFAFAILFFRSSQWSLLGPFVAVGLVLGSGIFILPTLYSINNSPKEGLPQEKSLFKKIVFGIMACLLAFIIMIVFFFVLVLGA